MQDGWRGPPIAKGLWLKDTIMEATVSKVFVEEKKFHSSGKLYNTKAFGTYCLLFVNIGIHCFVF